MPSKATIQLGDSVPAQCQAPGGDVRQVRRAPGRCLLRTGRVADAGTEIRTARRASPGRARAKYSAAISLILYSAKYSGPSPEIAMLAACSEWYSSANLSNSLLSMRRRALWARSGTGRARRAKSIVCRAFGGCCRYGSLDEVPWSCLDLDVGFAQVFAQDTDAKNLDAAKEIHRQYD